jgi:hypothetical protein
MVSGRLKFVLFFLFLALFLLGLCLLTLVERDGSDWRGFLASLFTICGCIGMFCVLLIRADDLQSDSEPDQP